MNASTTGGYATGWRSTISGVKFDLLNVQSEHIRAWDIAHALSMTCRYAGHTPILWSVLSHLGLCWQLMLHDDPQTNHETKVAVLLHDAAEAYIGDIETPIRRLPGMEAFNELDRVITKAIIERFGIDYSAVDWDIVTRYDKQALFLEYHRFFRDMSLAGHNPPVYDLGREPDSIPFTLLKPKDMVEALRNLTQPDNPEELFSAPVIIQEWEAERKKADAIVNELREMSRER